MLLQICKEPLCTECIIQSHNEHSVSSLATVYKECTPRLGKKELKKEPKELLANKLEIRLAFTKNLDEIEKKINVHT